MSRFDRHIHDGEPIVRVKGANKRFSIPGAWPWSPSREVSAVIDVNLTVRPGEVIALVGQSGSGKTTLSRMILGLERISSGEIWLDAHRWDQMGERERQTHRLPYQYIPQDALSALDPQQTVLEHVLETLMVLARKDRATAERDGAAMLARLGLAHRHDALPRELSGGEQRRVTLARVLSLSPRLVVADEPTSGLDPDRRAAVLEDLVGNLPDGASCLLVTHDLDAAQEWCHRAVVMLEGRVVEELDLRKDTPTHPYTRMLLDPWQNLPAPGAP